ncbi:class III extradiol ring-cleavage dioxygenase [uncultured Sphingomonas sp.]|uniref:DODA-type extradiol aromatic ring-opening family dioxygenase n=1 Tax=uncultured Sphingomonas sp. TaxID=158754 RepID=UPI00262FCF92|nr:class III extradiol ring-cleavage dioxygenase [uncultured Sphingomonas sp.]
MNTQPALFVSHGSPMIVAEPSAARDFLSGLGATLARPDAIVMLSAHYDMPGAVVTTAAHPGTIHDFGGFPDELYRLRYPAPGAPALAERVAALVEGAGVPVRADPVRGFDHGAWVPLLLGWPAADIPVVQLSISTAHGADWHYRIGRALAPLRAENVLVIGSGSMTHNLREVFAGRRTVDSPTPEWVSAFADWIHDRLAAGDTPAVLDAIALGPNGHRNHPTPDHFLPLPGALGAGGEGARASRLHHSYTYGVLAMDAYSFA